MNWFSNFFSSTIGRKVVMALTGLFIILFLVVHLIGNLQLLKSDSGQAFNIYAKVMTSNPFIKVISWVNYTAILVHVIWSIMITRRNRASRGSKGYAVVDNSSYWTSRNMGILGTFIFIFIIIHLRDFWYEMHWGGIPTATYDGVQYKNLYDVVNHVYSQVWFVALYVVSMALLGFHLFHGFGSAFQTLGLNHVKYNPVIKYTGVAFAIVVPALFALIPIYMYIN
jgi:succinate dehydrogenase / fumarate reductase, cytochrome b subunit